MSAVFSLDQILACMESATSGYSTTSQCLSALLGRPGRVKFILKRRLTWGGARWRRASAQGSWHHWESFGVPNCGASQNSIFIQQSHVAISAYVAIVAISAYVAIPDYVGISLFGTISSCVGSSASKCLLPNRNTYAW